MKRPDGTSSLRALLFDFGGTIAFLDYEMLASEFSRPGRRLDAQTLERAEYAGRAEIDRVMMAPSGRDLSQTYAAYFRSWMESAGVPAAEVDDLAVRFRALHDEESLWRVLRPGTIEALEKFRAAGLKLGVVSNATGHVENDAVRYGIKDYFDVIIDSAVVGVEKPDPRIFHLAMERLDVAPHETLFAGDIYSIDMLGAKAAGIAGKLIDVMSLYSWIDHVKIRGVPELHLLD
jgi:putative hydrolase of the HAD superfamily